VKATKDGTVPRDEPKLMKAMVDRYLGEEPFPEGVEIGCLNGRSAATLLASQAGLYLTSIDPFIPDSMAPTLIGSEAKALNLNAEAVIQGRYAIMKAYSWDVVNEFEDECLDLLFIDGDHRYPSVRKDLRLYAPKLKVGGLLFVHDCRMNRGGAHFHVGPSKLADEQLFGKPDNWELLGEAFSLAAFRKRG